MVNDCVEYNVYFLHEKLWVAFIEARETNGKFLKKKKKKLS